MNSRTLRRHTCALLAYAGLGICFSWPLPLHLTDRFLGSPGGDLGAYVWNLWVFRHQVVAHASSPFYTSEILSLTPPAALTLQNYTTFADVLAFPMLPVFGLIATFNVLSIAAHVLSAYAMFAYAYVRTRDGAAAWLGGVAFGFSSYITARQIEHLSLALAAPLPIFGLLMYRMAQTPTIWLAAVSGLVVAWAFLCDPYYAVYCLLILGFMVVHSLVNLDFRPAPLRQGWWTSILDLALCCIAGLIAAIVLWGGGQLRLVGVALSVTQLYTPTLLFTTLAMARVFLVVRPQMHYRWPSHPIGLHVVVATAVMLLVLAPLLYAMASPLGSPLSAPVLWRSSAPGLDLAAYLLPNPFHAWSPGWLASWISRQPNGFVENVASWSWVTIGAILFAALRYRQRPHVGWLAFTATFGLLSLGPFIRVAGVTTYIPTPWTLLRYVPVIGAARMPTRLAVLAILGLSMLFAMAIQRLRAGSAHPRSVTLLFAVLVVFELLPSPRQMYSAQIPEMFRHVAADPRSVRVLNLPLGLRDGRSSRGDFSSHSQFHQAFHEKPIIGGYLSRLPAGEVARYEQIPVMSELLDLSEGRALEPHREEAAIVHARESRTRLNIGWVVVDSSRASPQLIEFCRRAFDLRFVDSDERWVLYRSEPAVQD